MKKHQVIFVLGAAGSGKGTNCARLVKDFGFVHLSAGDLVRGQIAEGGPKANELKQLIEAGNLVSSKLLVDLFQIEFSKRESRTTFLIDGFPRNEENLQVWNQEIGDKIEIKFVLFFDCPEPVLIGRLKKRGRHDDTDVAIAKRLQVYRQESKPIIDRYNDQGLVRRVDTNGTEEEVYTRTRQFFS